MRYFRSALGWSLLDAAFRAAVRALALAAPVGLAILVVTTSAARADVITEMANFTTSQSQRAFPNIGAVFQLVLADSDSDTLDKFDPSLGTLDSVELLISGTIISSASATMAGLPLCPPAPVPIPCVANATLRLLDMQLSFVLPEFATTLSSFPNRAAPCTGVVCAVELPNFAVVASTSATLTGVTLNSYIGSGAVDVDMLQVGIVRLSDSSGGQYQTTLEGAIDAFGTVRARYHYTPFLEVEPPSIPAPGAVALFGLGLAGLSLTRRRRAA